MTASCKLPLADGFAVKITAGNKQAAPVVELLARVMKLAPGEAENELPVLTGEKENLFSMGCKTITCRISAPAKKGEVISAAVRVSLVIAHAVQKRGDNRKTRWRFSG